IDGTLTLDGENTISYGCVLHCGESVHLGYASIMAEYSSLSDSSHFPTDADYPVGANVQFAPSAVGLNTSICPRLSVGRVVTIGDGVAWMERTWRALAAQDFTDFEAIVVHDGNHGIKDLLESWQHKLPTLRAIEIAERATVPKRNAGWRAATAELIAFTDDD